MGVTKSATLRWWRHAVVTAALGVACASPEAESGGGTEPLVGKYVAKVDGSTLTYEFRPDGSVLFPENSTRLLWERSGDTVMVHSGPGSRFERYILRGDSLIAELPGLVMVRAKP